MSIAMKQIRGGQALIEALKKLFDELEKTDFDLRLKPAVDGVRKALLDM